MTSDISNNEGDAEELWSLHLQQWHARLRASASLLCKVSAQLQEAITDERRFAILTDTTPSDGRNREILEEYTEFDRLLKEALAALVDLGAYNNPEQEYPDLTKWFEFSCPNVFWGRHTSVITSKP